MTFKVLFICTHNSARSQMAEGLVNSLFSDRVSASSAGTSPGTVHPLAVQAMAEIGIDMSDQWSKGLDEVSGQRFDLIVTVCDSAKETCPVFQGGVPKEHAGFLDPSAVDGPIEERLAAFRKVRDDIERYVRARFSTIHPVT